MHAQAHTDVWRRFALCRAIAPRPQLPSPAPTAPPMLGQPARHSEPPPRRGLCMLTRITDSAFSAISTAPNPALDPELDSQSSNKQKQTPEPLGGHGARSPRSWGGRACAAMGRAAPGAPGGPAASGAALSPTPLRSAPCPFLPALDSCPRVPPWDHLPP